MAVKTKEEKRLHKLLDAWKKHIKDEIALHHKILKGPHKLKQHHASSLKIHHDFIKKIKKI